MNEGQRFFVDTSTVAYTRMTRAGFKIFDRILEDRVLVPDALRFDWLCYCGRQEGVDFYLPKNAHDGENMYMNGNMIDVAQYIEDLGGISESHLRSDGFTEEEIKYIRREYDAPSSNGRTANFEFVNGGSIPPGAANL